MIYEDLHEMFGRVSVVNEKSEVYLSVIIQVILIVESRQYESCLFLPGIILIS